MEHYLPKLSESGRRWVRFGGLVVALAALVWLCAALRGVLTPIVVALAIAYIFNPLITWLETMGVRRVVSVSVGLAWLLGISAMAILAGALQVVRFSQEVPNYLNELAAWLEPLIAPAASQPVVEGEVVAHPYTLQKLIQDAQLGDIARRHGVSVAQAIALSVPDMLARMLYWGTVVVVIPVYAFVLMLHFNQIAAAFRDHIPVDYRDTVVRVVSTIDRNVSDFFRGRLLICLLIGVLSALGWWIVGTPYSVALGLLSVPLNLVPYAGILILPPVLILTYIEAVQTGVGWFWPVTLAFGVYMVVQAIESFILAPTIYAKSTGLHFVTTIVALLIGAELAGVLGMLLSIPIASTLKSLGLEYLMPEVRRLAGLPQYARGEPAAPYGIAGPIDPGSSGGTSAADARSARSEP